MNAIKSLSVAVMMLCCANSAIAEEIFDPVTKAYAKHANVTLTEAKLRLLREGEIITLRNLLQKNNNYAGLQVIHSPEFKVRVYVKNVRGLLKAYTSDPLFEEIIVQRSKKELERAQNAITTALSAMQINFESDIDAAKGVVNIFITDPGRLGKALEPLTRQFPFVTITKVRALPVLTATFIGGQSVSAVSGCTSGFSVINSVGVRGVVTAAHCQYPATIQGVYFSTYSGRNWGGNYDQQWFTKSGHTYTNKIYTGDTSTSTINIYGASDAPLGWPVCKFGVTTGQTCGEVKSTTSSVNNNGAVGTFYRVQNYGSGYMCLEGDSGGPVWSSEGGAFGIVFARGANGSAYQYDMYYQPSSRFSALGVSVLSTP